MPDITPDENGKIDVSTLYDYYDYIDSIIAEKVKLMLVEMRPELSRNAAPKSRAAKSRVPKSYPTTKPYTTTKSAAPLLSTPELDKLWLDENVPPYAAPRKKASTRKKENKTKNKKIASRSSFEKKASRSDFEKKAPRPGVIEKASHPGFKKKVSIFVIGVIVLAVSVQLLSSKGIIDFHQYADWTAMLFGTVFAG
jgi:hypothetical protein